ncbi:hypothetical protein [Paraburkholderia solisilvae]|uniref:Uncharacterized protein n=1 Tax=Paraburkholderia solisilvae TaxID=624376 RepID=A0A6J5DRF9_9BURK|nr:hypothetical protein [Paraburkholderia solisilvae]CAB3755446.1 hypothetical protein LMG29739_02173 [Paraburkholderia solisilvae]
MLGHGMPRNKPRRVDPHSRVQVYHDASRDIPASGYRTTPPAAPPVSAAGTSAPKRHHEKHPHADRSEKNIDKAGEDSFPASDPPATGGTTRIDPDSSPERAKRDRPAPDKGGNS